MQDLMKLACHRASWLPLVPIRSFLICYPIPHEEQLLEVQEPQEDEDEDELTWVSPPGPEDLDTKPQVDMSLERSWLLQEGHWGLKLPMTSSSQSLLQALHLYS